MSRSSHSGSCQLWVLASMALLCVLKIMTQCYTSHMSHLVYADPMITACSSHHCVTLRSGHWLHTSGALLASAGSRLRPASGSGDTRARSQAYPTREISPDDDKDPETHETGSFFTIHNKLTLPSAKSLSRSRKEVGIL